MKLIKLLILTGAITFSTGKFAYSESSVDVLMCDTKLYDIPHGDYINLSKGTRYFYYGRRYDNWHNISAFTVDGYEQGNVTTENLFCVQ